MMFILQTIQAISIKDTCTSNQTIPTELEEMYAYFHILNHPQY